MKSLPSSLTLIVVTALMGCAPTDEGKSSLGQERCALTSGDIEAIHGKKATHEAQVLAADWEGMLTSFSPGFVNMPPNHAEIVGHEAVLAYLKTFPEVAEFQLTFEEVDGCGDVAYVKGLYSMALQPAESTEVVRDTGRWIWILRKNPEGRWVVTRNISNSDQPLATGS